MNTYTLKQLEQSIFSSAFRLTPPPPLQIDVRPEDIFVVKTGPDRSGRWIILLDTFSGTIVMAFPDSSSPNGDPL